MSSFPTMAERAKIPVGAASCIRASKVAVAGG